MAYGYGNRHKPLFNWKGFFMRLFTTVVILTTVFVTGYAGRSAAQLVSINRTNASLKAIITDIRQQTGYSVLIKSALLDQAKPITLNAENKALGSVLAELTEQTGLQFVVAEGKKVITVGTDAIDRVSGDASQQSTLSITGVITDTLGQGLRGATVRIKGGKGTMADARGQFSIREVPVDGTLQISNLGFETLELGIRRESNGFVVYATNEEQADMMRSSAGEIPYLQIRLRPTTNTLDDVVVQAYGETSDRLRTGNIATVRAEEIERRPVMNPLIALQGKVPGVEITTDNGYASAPFKVEIRGRQQINPFLSSEPLYIVDGVPLTVLEIDPGSADAARSGFSSGGLPPRGDGGGPQGQSPLFSINPADIESITVLKDADATAIYGSRGGQGVVIINTKKGQAGKTKFDAIVYSGFSRVPRYYDMMNTQEYLAMRKEAIANDGETPTMSNAPDILAWDTTAYTNWQRVIWGKTGITNDAQLNISGGDSRTTFRIGGNYHRQTDVMASSGSDQRSSLQFSLNHNSLDQRFNLAFTSFYSYTAIDFIGLPSYAVLLPPNAPAIFDSSGKLNYDGWNPLSHYYHFAGILQPYDSKTGFLNSQLQIGYNLTRNFAFTTNLGYSTHNLIQKSITPIASQNPEYNPTGSSSFGSTGGRRILAEPQLKFNHSLGRGNIELLVGGTIQRVVQDGNTSFGMGYINDNLLNSVSNAPIRNATNVEAQYNYAAAFGRINYNLDDKYILNLSARRDGSSKFGPGKQYGNFGAIGIAWIFSSEKWLSTIDWLSLGKIRSSYGLVGSDLIRDYGFLTRWTADFYRIAPYQGATSYLPTQHFNPEYRWQENRRMEIALQLGFLDDRVSWEIAAYRDRCGNQLIDYALPAITGFPFVLANTPALVQNAGIENSLRLSIIRKETVSWDFNFNIGVNRNKLLEFPNLEQSPYNSFLFIGEPLNLSQRLRFAGVDPQTGLYTFEDKDGDGEINPTSINEDLFLIDRNTRYAGGFGTDFSYKGLQLSLFFTYQNKPYVTNAYINSRVAGQLNDRPSQSVKLLDRWQQPGDIARFARYSTVMDVSNGYYLNSDAVLTDGSFVRLKNLAISYSFPKRLTETVKLSEGRFFFRGENLFLLTRYDGVDPEVPSFGALPLLRTLTFGIQANL